MPCLTGIGPPPNILCFRMQGAELKLEQLYSLVGADMRSVDAVIRLRLHSDVALVRQVAEYIIQSGGKRLRPILVLLAAGALALSPAGSVICEHRQCRSASPPA